MLFRSDEPREERADGEAIDIARMDAGKQRLGETFDRFAPEAAPHERRDRLEVVSAELSPGDCIAFHMLSVHGAPGVSGPNRRRVFSLRLLGDDMVHAPREWVTSPDMNAVFDGPDPRVAGRALAGEWFPRLA